MNNINRPRPITKINLPKLGIISKTTTTTTTKITPIKPEFLKQKLSEKNCHILIDCIIH